MTQTLPISKAREELADLVDKAKNRLDEYVITVNGSPAAVLISAAEYESWKETEEILADKELMKAIKQGEKEIDEGKGIPWDEVKKELDMDV
ncbi:MAG: type II toxin-antitoxin system Phd/YefM family antitoxin [Patescibacteria group bacterium]